MLTAPLFLEQKTLCVMSIDTITFDVLGLSDLAFPEAKNGVGEFIGEAEAMIRFKEYRDTGRVLPVSEKGFHRLKSSEYDVRYFIDHFKNKVSFHMSLPKVMFGTNVFMSVPKGLETFDIGEITFSSLALMREQVRLFLNTFFPRWEYDSTRVIVTRLDLCFNQVFSSQQERDLYYNHIKEYKPPYGRNSHTYHSSLNWTFAEYSLKCYKKLEEFDKNQKPKIEKAIKAGSKVWDLEKLERVRQLAARTLRYEASFRNGALSKAKWKSRISDEVDDYRINHCRSIMHKRWSLAIRGIPDKYAPNDYRGELDVRTWYFLVRKFLDFVEKFNPAPSAWDAVSQILDQKHKAHVRKKAESGKRYRPTSPYKGAFSLYVRLKYMGYDFQRILAEGFFPEKTAYAYELKFKQEFKQIAPINFQVDRSYRPYQELVYQIFGYNCFA